MHHSTREPYTTMRLNEDDIKPRAHARRERPEMGEMVITALLVVLILLAVTSQINPVILKIGPAYWGWFENEKVATGTLVEVTFDDTRSPDTRYYHTKIRVNLSSGDVDTFYVEGYSTKLSEGQIIEFGFTENGNSIQGNTPNPQEVVLRDGTIKVLGKTQLRWKRILWFKVLS